MISVAILWTNVPNQRGKSGTKLPFAIAEIAANFAIVTERNPVDDTNLTCRFALATDN